MKYVFIATMNGITNPYARLKKICDTFHISPRTVQDNIKKHGYYDKDGIKIEKKKIIR